MEKQAKVGQRWMTGSGAFTVTAVCDGGCPEHRNAPRHVHWSDGGWDHERTLFEHGDYGFIGGPQEPPKPTEPDYFTSASLFFPPLSSFYGPGIGQMLEAVRAQDAPGSPHPTGVVDLTPEDMERIRSAPVSEGDAWCASAQPTQERAAGVSAGALQHDFSDRYCRGNNGRYCVGCGMSEFDRRRAGECDPDPEWRMNREETIAGLMRVGDQRPNALFKPPAFQQSHVSPNGMLGMWSLRDEGKR